MARIMITGGAGFIGSHLCKRFLADGHEVLCVDNLITGSADNIAHLLPDRRFEFIHQDVTQYLYVKGALDSVLHFASPASPVDYLDFPIQTLKVGSLGTHKALGLAKEKNARFLLASTSEVYGDPLVHPQNEEYWGNVNPIGPRGVYDEAKRFAEAMTMAYHRAHGVETRIVRIFNSILADQPVVAFTDGELCLESVEGFSTRLTEGPGLPGAVLVPAFDPTTFRMELREASSLIRCRPSSDAFELKLRYGRSVKVTGDHSVFVRGRNGRPEARPVRDIRIGDHVAIPAKLPIVERDRTELHVSEELIRGAESTEDLWKYAIRHPSLRSVIESRREEIHGILLDTGRFRPGPNRRNTVVSITSRWRRKGTLPLFLLRALELDAPDDAEIAPYGASDSWVRDRVQITPDVLWLLGLYLAEGTEAHGRGSYLLGLCSDECFLRRAQDVLRSAFGLRNVGFVAATPGRGPSVYAHSKVVHRLFTRVLGLRSRRIPTWILQLPLGRVKHFLEGFRCGDGTHSGKKVGNELCFDTTSCELAVDLSYLLLRFGIVTSFGRYETTFRRRYGDRRFPFYRLTICSLDDFDVLRWDEGVRQNLNATRLGDLVWSQVRSVDPCPLSEYVYDFSVPDAENFVAGNGVICHNTYGPRMRRQDGRVVPNFITQALRGEELTVFGDGSQTRSFCFVEDLVEGIVRLLASDHRGPMNLGNPSEMTVLQFAERIRALVGSASRIVFKPLPVDDPKVRQPDISLARRVLGWQPKVSLDDGLARAIEWFRRTEERG